MSYVLSTTQKFTNPIEQVFDFFSDATNLEQITPPWLKFKITSPRPIEMAPGTLIDYSLKVRGFPCHWQSEISAWEPPYCKDGVTQARFVDEQRKGPYRAWHHQHCFRDVNGTTEVHDVVHYSVPGGALIHRLFVAPDLRRIFDYRQKIMAQTFEASGPSSPVALSRSKSQRGDV